MSASNQFNIDHISHILFLYFTVVHCHRKHTPYAAVKTCTKVKDNSFGYAPPSCAEGGGGVFKTMFW